MALSRIWSAFIIIAIVLAGIKALSVDGQQDIFSRMVTSRSDDSYNYIAVGMPPAKVATVDSFVKLTAPFAYNKKEKPEDAAYIVTDNPAADTVKLLKAKFPALRVFTYSQVLNRLQKPIDGLIETCKGAVNICLGLIGIMAFFMGLMGIAEKAGGSIFCRGLSALSLPASSPKFPRATRPWAI